MMMVGCWFFLLNFSVESFIFIIVIYMLNCFRCGVNFCFVLRFLSLMFLKMNVFIIIIIVGIVMILIVLILILFFVVYGII